MEKPDISVEIVSTITELISSCESTYKTLETVSSNNDAVFDLSCVANRIETLIPVLESTERCVRVEYLKDLKDSNGKVSLGIIKKLDLLESSALKVWNVADLRLNECENYLDKKNDNIIIDGWQKEFMKVAMSIKYYVCLLLIIHALLQQEGDGKVILRVLKCLFRVYHECTDLKDSKNGKSVKDCVEKIFTYLENLDAKDSLMKMSKDTLETMKIEFWILDMQNAFLSNNISMAKFYEAKANVVSHCLNMKNENVFNICRTLHNDGLILYQEEKYQDSHYFLEKCYLIMEKLGERISNIGPENKIKVSTLTLLAKCCIKLGTPESIDKANKLIKLLQLQETERLESLKLQIEMIEFQNFTPQEVEDLIMTIIISFPSDAKFLKQVRMIFNSFSYKEPVIAKQALLYLFTNKINFSDLLFDEVSESYFISLIWIITSQINDKQSSEECIRSVQKLLEIADKKITKELGRETIFCVMILLWSQGKKCMKKTDYVTAKQWISFCFSRIFQIDCTNGDNDDMTIGKVQRSYLECCIKTDEFNQFTEIYDKMSTENKNCSITMYFKFLFELKTQKGNWVNVANAILKQISMVEDVKSVEILALCVIETKNLGSTVTSEISHALLTNAMKTLLDKCELDANHKKDQLLLVALRSSVYVYGKGIDMDTKNAEIEISNIVRSVDQFITYMDLNKNVEETSNLLEDFEWFASNCYNYGLLLIEKDILNQHVANLFECVCNMFTLLPEKEKMKYMKWKSKSIIFKSLCAKVYLKSSSCTFSEEKTKWFEIQKENEDQLKLFETINPEDLDKEIVLQHQLLIDEGLIRRKSWTEIIKILKTGIGNTALDNISYREQEIDSVLEILLDSSVGAFDKSDCMEIKSILDVIILECAFNKQCQISEHVVFKWLYLIINKLLLEQIFFEEAIKGYVDYFIDFIKSKDQRQSEAFCNEDRIKDYEFEWLAGMAWNKGIEAAMKNQKTGSDRKVNTDPDSSIVNTSIDESGYEDGMNSWHGSSIKRRKLNEKSTSLIRESSSVSEGWCELAIAVSKFSSSQIQHDRMSDLMDQLRKNSEN